MKPYVKIIGVTALALGLLSFKKYTDYSHVIKEMQFFIDKVRNLRQRNGKFYFDFDLVFYNPTNIDFVLETSGLINVKRIDVLFKGKKLGAATSDVSAIYLPSKTGYRITQITIELLLLELVNLFSSDAELDASLFSAQVTVEALGMTYIIDQKII